MILNTKINGIQILGLCSALPDYYSKYENGVMHYICAEEQTTSDLGYVAARKLVSHIDINAEDIGFLIFGSRTPDYRSPVTAAVLQSRLGLTKDCICYDVNVGVNAFVQLTQLGGSLLSSMNKNYGLIIFGDTPSKLRKNSVNSFFSESDAATAVLLRKGPEQFSIEFINKSIGKFYDAQILRAGGFRDYDSFPFDATKEENFVVRQKDIEMEQVAELNKEIFLSFVLNASIGMMHSQLFKYLNMKDIHHNQRKVLAAASELPILLSTKVVDTINAKEIALVSMGEGLAIYGMKFNHIPECLPTVKSNMVFSDYKISHEM